MIKFSYSFDGVDCVKIQLLAWPHAKMLQQHSINCLYDEVKPLGNLENLPVNAILIHKIIQ